MQHRPLLFGSLSLLYLVSFYHKVLLGLPHMSRGNTALFVSMTAATTLLAPTLTYLLAGEWLAGYIVDKIFK